MRGDVPLQATLKAQILWAYQHIICSEATQAREQEGAQGWVQSRTFIQVMAVR